MAWSERTPAVYADAPKLRRLALMTTGFVLFQLLFGAIYRHTGMMLHVHFLGAVLVFVHVLLLFKRVRKTVAADPWLTKSVTLLVGLLFVQIGLGIYTWQRPSIPDATAHVAVGALMLAAASVISLQTFRRVQA